MDQANQGSGTAIQDTTNPTPNESNPEATPILIQQEVYQPPMDFLVQSDDHLDQFKKSKAIELSGLHLRTCRLKKSFKADGNVKTVLGKKPMERYSMKAESQSNLATGSEDPSRSKFYVAFRIDNLASTCVCVGLQEEGADLEKDSFEFKMSFQLNCSNGDIMRVGQQKKYVTPDIATVHNGSIVGMMVNLYDGELSFAIDDKFCGIASKDKRLKMGKFYACVLLMNSEDRVTMVNPDSVRQASHGYELIFSKLNMPKEQYSPFYNLFGRIQNHFSQHNSENDLQRLLVMAFLNDRDKHDKLANMVLEVYKREHQGVDDSEYKPPSSDLPKSFASIQKEYIIKQFLTSHMTPNLISHVGFQDDYLKNAFEDCQTKTIINLIHFYFMIQSMEQKLQGSTGDQMKESMVDLDVKSVAQSVAPSVAKSVAKSVAPSQMKDGAPFDPADQKENSVKVEEEESKEPEWTKEVIESEIDFLSLRVHHLLSQYPQPKLTKDMERKVKDSEENMFKFKLMEIKEKMMKMSTQDFDSISQGRVEKQTDDFCMTVLKTLFKSAKRARTIIEEQEEKDEASAIDKNALNQKMMKKFDDFSAQLE